MSRRGNCWDDAVVESFSSSLKTEIGIIHGRFDSTARAQRQMSEHIERFYNHQRLHLSLDTALVPGHCTRPWTLHSSLDDVSPVEYKRSYRDEKAEG